MARIRTIKPEFPQSESMGNVSRDARLCFVMLWTIADDAGRLRGASRMLASLLFPYDDDAPGLIDKWLAELERESCIVRYEIDGARYIQVANWLDHQKIDRPSRSNIPPFDEGSRTIAKPREASCEDQRTKDQGPKDQEERDAIASPKKDADHAKRGSRLAADWEPDSEDRAFAEELGLQPDSVWPEYRDFWIAVPGGRGVKLDWRATWRNHCRRLAKRSANGARGAGRLAERQGPVGELAAAGRALARLTG